MKLRELQNGQLVTFRLGFAGPTGAHWRAWQTGPLYIQRRAIDLPKAMRKYNGWQAGTILILTPMHEHNTAEFSEQEFDGQDTFTCEEHFIQIQGLEP